MNTELLHQPVDLPGRHAVDIRLHHDREDRLLRRPPRLQKRRKVRGPGPLTRHQQIDLPNPGLPHPRAIPVAMRLPLLGRDLAEPRADLTRDLGLHQLAHKERDRALQKLVQITAARPGNDIRNRHALHFGHRGALLLDQLVVELTSMSATVVGTAPTSGARYTTSTDMTPPDSKLTGPARAGTPANQSDRSLTAGPAPSRWLDEDFRAAG